MHGYWAARGLAERGHKVYVVTNANEIEDIFRIDLSSQDLSEGGEYARSFPETGGFVQVRSTEPPDRSQLYYIPMGNPTVTRLATIATDIIRRHQCEVIFSYYFEPYGMAAYLASKWTGIPYILKHAGSDLNRLLPLEELKTAYLEIMAAANRILSHGLSRKQLLDYGIREDRLTSDVAFKIPTAYFNPRATPLDINGLLVELAAEQSESGSSTMIRDFSPINTSLPTLGIYGKLGEYKGSFDLAYAMDKVLQSRFPFNLIALSHGWQEERFGQILRYLGIAEYVRVLPFLPHWRIPSFIRACTAVAFLERDFPIPVHTPTIPSEIISCGQCAIISEEVVRKQMFRHQVRHRKNLIVVKDPKNHAELAESIAFALEDPVRASEIGLRGLEELAPWQPYSTYIDALESVLTEVAQEKPAERAVGSQLPSNRSRRDVMETIRTLFPYTHALLDAENESWLREKIVGTIPGVDVNDKRASALELGRTLLSVLGSDLSKKLSPLYETCRYECKLHEWSKVGNSTSDGQAIDISFTADELVPLVPTIQGNWEILEFTYDVEAIANSVHENSEITVIEEPIKVLFHTGSLPMRLNQPTEILLRLLDEINDDMGTLFEVLAEIYDCSTPDSKSSLIESSISVLEGLYWEGFLNFRQPCTS